MKTIFKKIMKSYFFIERMIILAGALATIGAFIFQYIDRSNDKQKESLQRKKPSIQRIVKTSDSDLTLLLKKTGIIVYEAPTPATEFESEGEFFVMAVEATRQGKYEKAILNYERYIDSNKNTRSEKIKAKIKDAGNNIIELQKKINDMYSENT